MVMPIPAPTKHSILPISGTSTTWLRETPALSANVSSWRLRNVLCVAGCSKSRSLAISPKLMEGFACSRWPGGSNTSSGSSPSLETDKPARAFSSRSARSTAASSLPAFSDAICKRALPAHSCSSISGRLVSSLARAEVRGLEKIALAE